MSTRRLQTLKAMGLRVALLSGDNRNAVEDLATTLGIAEFHAECTPQQKLAIIEAAQGNGERVVMVGDGINDAPVLSGADTSVAPAHGALLAQTSADVILLGRFAAAADYRCSGCRPRPCASCARISPGQSYTMRWHCRWLRPDLCRPGLPRSA